LSAAAADNAEDVADAAAAADVGDVDDEIAMGVGTMMMKLRR
jgi:hypothetical protein